MSSKKVWSLENYSSLCVRQWMYYPDHPLCCDKSSIIHNWNYLFQQNIIYQEWVPVCRLDHISKLHLMRSGESSFVQNYPFCNKTENGVHLVRASFLKLFDKTPLKLSIWVVLVDRWAVRSEKPLCNLISSGEELDAFWPKRHSG